MSDRSMTRRQFLRRSAGAVAIGGAGALGYTWRIEPHWVSITTRDLPIAMLPAALQARTLIHLSDIHVGTVVNDEYLINTFAQAAEFKPDILVLTGDLMSYDRPKRIEHTLRVLSKLPMPSLGIFTVLGNHDYGNQLRLNKVADELVNRLDREGHTVLRDQCTEVEGLTIAGLDDYRSWSFNPHRALGRLLPDRPNLVLCHNPDIADEDVWSGYKGWILCGHTHGGQCRVPFLGPPILPVRNRRYSEGEIDLYDGRTMYINRGLGYLKRLRFGVRPEITVFTLRRDDSPAVD